MRDGLILMVDDDRLRPRAGEPIEPRLIRFRTLGCWPLSGALESQADTIPAVIAEMRAMRTSERQGRRVDHEEAASMEMKKREGFF